MTTPLDMTTHWALWRDKWLKPSLAHQAAEKFAHKVHLREPHQPADSSRRLQVQMWSARLNERTPP